MFSNFYVQQRIKKMELMREEGLNPYSNKTTRTITNCDFLSKYHHLKTESVNCATDSTQETPAQNKEMEDKVTE